MTQIQSSTRKHYKQLSETERGAIGAYLKVGLSANQIAGILGRSPSTIAVRSNAALLYNATQITCFISSIFLRLDKQIILNIGAAVIQNR